MSQLNVKGPGNGLIKGGFGTGSEVNENLPNLKLNGNLLTQNNRVTLLVSSNNDNTFESGHINLSSTSGFDSYWSPDFFGIHHGNRGNVQFFSQNWSGKGHTGYVILRGPNSINFEIGSKFWDNSDLPWMNMRGTTGVSLMQFSGEKYQESGVDKEKGQLTVLDWDNNRAFINSREINLLKPNGGQFAGLNSHGNAGNFFLNGPNSENVYIGTMGENADRARMSLKGANGDHMIDFFIMKFENSPEYGELYLRTDDGAYTNLRPNGLSSSGTFHIGNSVLVEGNLFLNGKNTNNFYLGTGGDPDQGILDLNGKTNQLRARMFVKTDWDNQEKGTIELHGEDGNKVGIIPTQFALHNSDWSITASLNNTGASGQLELRGPNTRNFVIGSTHWENSDKPWFNMNGKDDKVKMSMTTIDDVNGERAILTLSNSNGTETTYANNGTWGTGPFNMWTGAMVNGTLTVNGNINGSGTNNYNSDERLKKEIKSLGGSTLHKIESLGGYSYFWKKEEFPEKNFSADQQIGLLAQELETQFPALVKTGSDGFKSVNYNGFTVVLLQAVKELNQKVEALEKDNKLLRDELMAASASQKEMNELKSHIHALAKLVQLKIDLDGDLQSAQNISNKGLK